MHDIGFTVWNAGSGEKSSDLETYVPKKSEASQALAKVPSSSDEQDLKKVVEKPKPLLTDEGLDLGFSQVSHPLFWAYYESLKSVGIPPKDLDENGDGYLSGEALLDYLGHHLGDEKVEKVLAEFNIELSEEERIAITSGSLSFAEASYKALGKQHLEAKNYDAAVMVFGMGLSQLPNNQVLKDYLWQSYEQGFRVFWESAEHLEVVGKNDKTIHGMEPLKKVIEQSEVILGLAEFGVINPSELSQDRLWAMGRAYALMAQLSKEDGFVEESQAYALRTEDLLKSAIDQDKNSITNLKIVHRLAQVQDMRGKKAAALQSFRLLSNLKKLRMKKPQGDFNFLEHAEARTNLRAWDQLPTGNYLPSQAYELKSSTQLPSWCSEELREYESQLRAERDDLEESVHAEEEQVNPNWEALIHQTQALQSLNRALDESGRNEGFSAKLKHYQDALIVQEGREEIKVLASNGELNGVILRQAYGKDYPSVLGGKTWRHYFSFRQQGKESHQVKFSETFDALKVEQQQEILVHLLRASELAHLKAGLKSVQEQAEEWKDKPAKTLQDQTLSQAIQSLPHYYQGRLAEFKGKFQEAKKHYEEYLSGLRGLQGLRWQEGSKHFNDISLLKEFAIEAEEFVAGQEEQAAKKHQTQEEMDNKLKGLLAGLVAETHQKGGQLDIDKFSSSLESYEDFQQAFFKHLDLDDRVFTAGGIVRDSWHQAFRPGSSGEKILRHLYDQLKGSSKANLQDLEQHYQTLLGELAEVSPDMWVQQHLGDPSHHGILQDFLSNWQTYDQETLWAFSHGFMEVAYRQGLVSRSEYLLYQQQTRVENSEGLAYAKHACQKALNYAPYQNKQRDQRWNQYLHHSHEISWLKSGTTQVTAQHIQKTAELREAHLSSSLSQDQLLADLASLELLLSDNDRWMKGMDQDRSQRLQELRSLRGQIKEGYKKDFRANNQTILDWLDQDEVIELFEKSDDFTQDALQSLRSRVEGHESLYRMNFRPFLDPVQLKLKDASIEQREQVKELIHRLRQVQQSMASKYAGKGIEIQPLIYYQVKRACWELEHFIENFEKAEDQNQIKALIKGLDQSVLRGSLRVANSALDDDGIALALNAARTIGEGYVTGGLLKGAGLMLRASGFLAGRTLGGVRAYQNTLRGLQSMSQHWAVKGGLRFGKKVVSGMTHAGVNRGFSYGQLTGEGETTREAWMSAVWTGMTTGITEPIGAAGKLNLNSVTRPAQKFLYSQVRGMRGKLGQLSRRALLSGAKLARKTAKLRESLKHFVFESVEEATQEYLEHVGEQIRAGKVGLRLHEESVKSNLAAMAGQAKDLGMYGSTSAKATADVSAVALAKEGKSSSVKNKVNGNRGVEASRTTPYRMAAKQSAPDVETFVPIQSQVPSPLGGEGARRAGEGVAYFDARLTQLNQHTKSKLAEVGEEILLAHPDILQSILEPYEAAQAQIIEQYIATQSQQLRQVEEVLRSLEEEHVISISKQLPQIKTHEEILSALKDGKTFQAITEGGQVKVELADPAQLETIVQAIREIYPEAKVTSEDVSAVALAEEEEHTATIEFYPKSPLPLGERVRERGLNSEVSLEGDSPSYGGQASLKGFPTEEIPNTHPEPTQTTPTQSARSSIKRMAIGALSALGIVLPSTDVFAATDSSAVTTAPSMVTEIFQPFINFGQWILNNPGKATGISIAVAALAAGVAYAIKNRSQTKNRVLDFIKSSKPKVKQSTQTQADTGQGSQRDQQEESELTPEQSAKLDAIYDQYDYLKENLDRMGWTEQQIYTLLTDVVENIPGLDGIGETYQDLEYISYRFSSILDFQQWYDLIMALVKNGELHDGAGVLIFNVLHHPYPDEPCFDLQKNFDLLIQLAEAAEPNTTLSVYSALYIIVGALKGSRRGVERGYKFLLESAYDHIYCEVEKLPHHLPLVLGVLGSHSDFSDHIPLLIDWIGRLASEEMLSVPHESIVQALGKIASNSTNPLSILNHWKEGELPSLSVDLLAEGFASCASNSSNRTGKQDALMDAMIAASNDDDDQVAQAFTKVLKSVSDAPKLHNPAFVTTAAVGAALFMGDATGMQTLAGMAVVGGISLLRLIPSSIVGEGGKKAAQVAERALNAGVEFLVGAVESIQTFAQRVLQGMGTIGRTGAMLATGLMVFLISGEVYAQEVDEMMVSQASLKGLLGGVLASIGAYLAKTFGSGSSEDDTADQEESPTKIQTKPSEKTPVLISQTLGKTLKQAIEIFKRHDIEDFQLSLREVGQVRNYIEVFAPNHGVAKAAVLGLWLSLTGHLPPEQINGQLGVELRALIANVRIEGVEPQEISEALNDVLSVKPVEFDVTHDVAKALLKGALQGSSWKNFEAVEWAKLIMPLDPEHSFQLLEQLSEHPEQHVRKEAIESLGLLGQYFSTDDEKLNSIFVRLKRLVTVDSFNGSPPILALGHLLHGAKSNPKVRREILDYFKELASQEAEVASVVNSRVMALGNIEALLEEDPDLFEIIFSIIETLIETEMKNSLSVESAFNSLARLGLSVKQEPKKLGKIYQMILKATRDEKKYEFVREHAIKALGVISQAYPNNSKIPKSIFKLLKKLSQDSSQNLKIRAAAIEALTHLELKEVSPLLEELFAKFKAKLNERGHAQYVIVEILGVLSPLVKISPQDFQTIFSVFKDPTNEGTRSKLKHETVRQAMIKALGPLAHGVRNNSTAVREIFFFLKEIMDSGKDHPFTRQAVVEALGTFNEVLTDQPELAQKVCRLLQNALLVPNSQNARKDLNFRQTVLAALQKLGKTFPQAQQWFESERKSTFQRYKGLKSELTVDSVVRISESKGDKTDLPIHLNILANLFRSQQAGANYEIHENPEVVIDENFDPTLVTAHQLVDRVVQALAINRFILLSGDPASGKTEVGRYISKLLNWPHRVFNAHRYVSEEELMQKIGVMCNGESRFTIMDGPLAQALRNGELFIFNEIHRAKPGNLSFLFKVLADIDEEFEYYDIKQGKMVRARIHPNFRMIATRNLDGTNMNAALKNRAIEFHAKPYGDLELESLLRSRLGEEVRNKRQSSFAKATADKDGELASSLMAFYSEFRSEMESGAIAGHPERYAWTLRHLMRLVEGFLSPLPGAGKGSAEQILQIFYEAVGVSLRPQDRPNFFQAIRRQTYNGITITAEDVAEFQAKQQSLSIWKVCEEFGIDRERAESLAEEMGIQDIPTSARYLRSILQALKKGYHPWLKGPHGTGKSQLARYAARLLGVVYMDTLTPQSDEGQLKGEFKPKIIHLNDGSERLGFDHIPAPLVQALRHSGDPEQLITVILDEASFGRPDVMEELHTLLDRDGGIWVLNERGDQYEFLERPKNFRLILASNTYGYEGVNLQSDAFRSRTHEIYMDFEYGAEEIATLLQDNNTLHNSIAQVFAAVRSVFTTHSEAETTLSLREIGRIKRYLDLFLPKEEENDPKVLAKVVVRALWQNFAGHLSREQQEGELGRQLQDAIAKLEIEGVESQEIKQALDTVVNVKPVEFDEGKDVTETLLHAAFRGTFASILDKQDIANLMIPIDPHLSLELLLELCEDENPSVRRDAVESLVRLSEYLEGETLEQAVEVLTKLCEDEIEYVHQSAAKSLGTLSPYLEGEALTKALKVLTKLCEDEKRYVRQSAANSLGTLSPYLEGEAKKQALTKVLKVLTKLCEDEKQQIRQSAAQSFRTLSPYLEGETLEQAVEVLTKLCEDEIEYVRQSAANSLGTLSPYLEGEALTKVLKVLTKLCEDEKEFVRRFAAKSLGRLSEYLESDALRQAFDVLRKLCGDESENVRQSAAQSFRTLSPYLEGETLEQAVEVLTKLCEDEKEYIRQSAAEFLGTLSPYLEGEAKKQALTKALKVLTKLCEDEKEYIRQSAPQSFRTLSPYLEGETLEQAVEVLTKLCEDEKEYIRQSAAQSLGTLSPYLEGEALTKALKVLTKLCEDEKRYVRQSAAQSLGTLSPYLEGEAKKQALTKALKVLTKLCEDEKEYIRKPAAEPLGRLSEYLEGDALRQAFDVLRKLCGDESENVRHVAAQTLQNLATKLPKFQQMLSDLLAPGLKRYQQLKTATVDSAVRISPAKGDETDLPRHLEILADLFRSQQQGANYEIHENPELVIDENFDPTLVTAHQLVDRVVQALAINRFVLLSGDPASGKTEVGRYISKLLNWPHRVFNAHRYVSEEELMQKIGVMCNGESRFTIMDGPLAQALRNGELFIFNEIHRAKSGNLSFLFKILADIDEEFEYYDIKQGKMVRARIHPNFRMIATRNLDGMDMNAALKNRAIEFHAKPYADLELESLLRSSPLPTAGEGQGEGDLASSLVTFYSEFRHEMESGAIGDHAEGYAWTLRHLMRLAEGFRSPSPPLRGPSPARGEGSAEQILQIFYETVGVSLRPEDRPNFFEAIRRQTYNGIVITEEDVAEFQAKQQSLSIWEVCEEFGIDQTKAKSLAEEMGMQDIPTSARYLRSILQALKKGYHPWLKGPHGTGKSQLARYAARLLGVVYMDTLTPQSDEGQLKGEFKPKVIHLNDGSERLGFDHIPAPLVQALRHSGDPEQLITVILDEASFGRPDVMEELNTLLDRDGGIWVLNEKGDGYEFLERPKNFRLILASNTYGYEGVNLQSDAFRSRTHEIYMDFEYGAEEIATLLQDNNTFHNSIAQVFAAVRSVFTTHSEAETTLSLREIGRIKRYLDLFLPKEEENDPKALAKVVVRALWQNFAGHLPKEQQEGELGRQLQDAIAKLEIEGVEESDILALLAQEVELNPIKFDAEKSAAQNLWKMAVNGNETWKGVSYAHALQLQANLIHLMSDEEALKLIEQVSGDRGLSRTQRSDILRTLAENPRVRFEQRVKWLAHIFSSSEVASEIKSSVIVKLVRGFSLASGQADLLFDKILGFEESELDKGTAIQELLQHPEVTQSQLSQWVQPILSDPILAASYTFYIFHGLAYAPKASSDQLEQVMTWALSNHNFGTQYKLLQGVSQNPNLTSTQLGQIMAWTLEHNQNIQAVIIRTLIKNPQVSSDYLGQIIDEVLSHANMSWFVKVGILESIAQHPQVSSAQLEQCFEEELERVKAGSLTNTTHIRFNYFEALLKSPQASPSQLSQWFHKILRSTKLELFVIEELLSYIVQNPRASFDQLRQWFDRALLGPLSNAVISNAILKGLVQNPQLNSDQLTQWLNEVLNSQLSSNIKSETFLAVVKSPRLSPNQLERWLDQGISGFELNDWYIRMLYQGLIKNLQTTESQLARVIDWFLSDPEFNIAVFNEIELLVQLVQHPQITEVQLRQLIDWILQTPQLFDADRAKIFSGLVQNPKANSSCLREVTKWVFSDASLSPETEVALLEKLVQHTSLPKKEYEAVQDRLFKLNPELFVKQTFRLDAQAYLKALYADYQEIQGKIQKLKSMSVDSAVRVSPTKGDNTDLPRHLQILAELFRSQQQGANYEINENPEVVIDENFDPTLVTAHQLVDRVIQALAINRFVLLSGDPASGKTEVGRYISKLLNWPHRIFNAHRYVSEEELMQKIGVMCNGESRFTIMDGPLAQALRNGELFIFNEIHRAKPGNLSFLFKILADIDEEFEYYDIKQGKMVRARIHPNFRMIATRNLDGTNMNAALKNRAIEFHAKPYGDLELESLLRSSPLPTAGEGQGEGDLASSLVGFYSEFRHEMEAGAIGDHAEGYAWTLRHLMRLAEGFLSPLPTAGEGVAQQILQIFYETIGVSLRPEDRPNFFQAIRRQTYNGITISQEDIDQFQAKQQSLSIWEVCEELGISRENALALAEEMGIQDIPTSARYLRSILQALKKGYHPWLKGPHGTGKSQLARYAARLLGVVYMDTLTPQSDEGQLKGEFKPKIIHLNDGSERLGFDHIPAPLVQALRHSGDPEQLITVILDEASFGRPDVMEELHTLLDRDGGIWVLNERGDQYEFLERPKNFRLILASNTYGYEGVNLQSDAFRSRTHEIYMGFEYTAEEMDILLGQPQVTPPVPPPGQAPVPTLPPDLPPMMPPPSAMAHATSVESSGGLYLAQPSVMREPQIHAEEVFTSAVAFRQPEPLTVDMRGSPIRDKLQDAQLELPEKVIRQLEEKFERVKSQLLGAAAAIGRTGDLVIEFDPKTKTCAVTLEAPRIFKMGPQFLLELSIEDLLNNAIHEGGHVDITRIGSGFFFKSEVLRALWNTVEDIRVDARAVDRAPGRKDSYQDFLKRYYYEGYQKLSKDQIPKLLPHEAFMQALMSKEYGGASPWDDDPLVGPAIVEAWDAVQAIKAERPQARDPEERLVQQHVAKMEEILKEKILPIYQRLYQEAVKQVEKGIQEGEIKVSSPGKTGKDGKSGQPGGQAPLMDPKDLSEAAKKLLEKRAKQIADYHAPKGDLGEQQGKARIIFGESGKGEVAPFPHAQAGTAKPGSMEHALQLKHQAHQRQQQALKGKTYSQMLANLGDLPRKLFVILDRLLKPNTDFEYEPGFHSGAKVMIEQAFRAMKGWSANLRVFKRKTEPTARDYRFSLLLDASASMADNGARERGGLGLAAMFMDVFERLKVSYSLDAFHNGYIPLKAFKDKMLTTDQRNQFFNQMRVGYWGMGGTNIRGGIKGAVRRILEARKGDPRDHELLFVLTDGEETNQDGATIRQLCDEAAKRGVIIVGIGIGEGMQTVREHFPVHLTESNPENLPRLMGDFIKEYVRRYGEN